MCSAMLTLRMVRDLVSSRWVQKVLCASLIIACHVQGAWEAAENILNTIVLPPAIDDAGGAGSKNYDYTQVSLLFPAKPSLILYFTLMRRGALHSS